MELSKKKDILFQEKRRHGLLEQISNQEIKLLKKEYPIQKIIGFINFDNLPIKINYQNVFIPRYETEELVNHAIKYIQKNDDVLDLCCGSGYIGLTIKQKTNANVWALDISKNAIKQTKLNAKLNHLNIKIIKSNLFKKINHKFNVIICNPPYLLKKNQNKLAQSVIKFESKKALFGGNDGNFYYKKILKKAPLYLKKNGWLFFEISPDNATFLRKNNFQIILDINKKTRIAFKQF